MHLVALLKVNLRLRNMSRRAPTLKGTGWLGKRSYEEQNSLGLSSSSPIPCYLTLSIYLCPR